MKIFNYITLIALMIFNHPLLAMNALRKKQADVAAEQEKKAISTLKKLRIRKKQAKLGKEQPEVGAGIKTFESTAKYPIKLDPLEQKTRTTIYGPKVDWYPTADALTKFLNTYPPLKAYLPGMPEVIVENSTSPGNRNIALFVAYRNANQKAGGAFVKGKPLFFLKISTPDNNPNIKTTAQKLDALQKGPVGRFGLKALSNRELPIVALQEMFFIYKGNDNKNYTIEVMHLAHGKSLLEIIDAHNQDDQQWAKKVGKALGLFHREFMNYNNSNDPAKWTTMSHGDFHLGNVFFDEKTSRVYFIDNADMQMRNPFNDLKFLERLIMHGFSEAEDKDYPSFKNLTFTLHFIKGYLSVYPLAERKAMVEYLKEKLRSVYDELKHARRGNRKKVVGDFITNLNTIFDEASAQ